MTFESPIKIQVEISMVRHEYCTTIGYIQAEAYKELLPHLPTTKQDLTTLRDEYYQVKRVLFSNPNAVIRTDSSIFGLIDYLTNPHSPRK